MRDAGYTKQERSLFTLTRILMVLFFLTTILFIILPNWTLTYLTNIGRGIFGFAQPPIPLGAEHFWLILAIAYLVALTYICFLVQHDFLRNIDYLKVIILAKFVSTVGFLFCFFKYDRYFFYIVGAAIDGLIFLITWYYYHAAKKSRTTQ